MILRIFIKSLVFLSFFFIPATVFSQYTLSGNVVNIDNVPVSYATVQVFRTENNHLQNYSFTNDLGDFEFENTGLGSFKIKISHTSYESKEVLIEITSKSIRVSNIYLEPKMSALEEVVIQAESGLAKVMEDTIVYNIEKVKNGKENTLGDILHKLPGIRVGANGALTVNGNSVDKLLIDGEEMFKNQNKIAISNITSEMVEGVTFFNKFENFANLKGFDNDVSNALSIKIKEKFKNKITGILDIFGAVKEKYAVGLNLFRFGGKLKSTLISDANTTGEETISIYDYIQLNQSIESENQKREFFWRETRGIDVPEFLTPRNDIASRKESFVAFNIVYKPTSNFKSTLYSITNNSEQNAFTNSIRRFFEQAIDPVNENKFKLENYLFTSTIIDMSYKLSESNLLKYTFKLNYNDNDLDWNIRNEQRFDQNKEKNKVEGSQQFLWSTSFSKSWLLELKAYMNWKNINERLRIDSDQSFLNFRFTDTEFILDQRKENVSKTYGLTVSFTKKQKKSLLSYYSGYYVNNQSFHTDLGNPNSVIDIDIFNSFDYKIKNRFLGFESTFKLNKSIRLNMGISYNYFTINPTHVTKNNVSALFPKIGLNFKFSGAKKVELNYLFKSNTPEINYFAKQNYVKDYLGIFDYGNTGFTNLLNKQEINLLYSNITFSSGISTIFETQFTFAPKLIENNTNLQSINFSIYKDAFIENTYDFYTSLFLEKRLKKQQLLVSLHNSYFQNGNDLIINGSIGRELFRNYKVKSKVRSDYSLFNYEIAIDYGYNRYENTISAVQSEIHTIKPSLSLSFDFLKDALKSELQTAGNYFISDFGSQSFFSIQPKIQYVVSNSLQFWVRGNNILNLDSAQIIENRNLLNYSEEITSGTLEGFIGFGVNYKF